MNLKSKSQKLSQGILLIALGLIVYPESAKAATSTLPTESLELSKPTLLVNSVKQVSMLVEASNTIDSELSNNLSSTAIDNVTNNTYTIAKDAQVTPLEEVTTETVELNVVKTANLPPQNSVQTLNNPSLIASNEVSTSTVVQENSLSIPIKVEFQAPVNIKNEPQSISIPVEVEQRSNIAPVINNSDRANNSINIPVVTSVNEEIFVQQTETEPLETLGNVERPTLISNTRTSFNQNLDRRNSRIINPAPNPQTNQGPSSGNLMSSVPIQVEYYNPMVTPSAGQMVSPDLPQINSPDPYLPDNSRPFNGFIWPAQGVFTSGYGWRWGRMHKGIDVAGPVGTPIVAAAEGEVISAGWNSGGFGNLVKIQHLDGTVTLYAHNSKIHVRRGQFVKQGQHIANMGSTGFSTGPHLHFEIHPQGQKAVNPIALLPKK
ncbi:putative peptidase [Geminocystis sp. NIES-3708]|nr:M23 family metallopeptidase [Geminocystis sp. NIES-3708]BAQ62405.1 putative peptidase [Geminocystis sp. NIES-3708]